MANNIENLEHVMTREEAAEKWKKGGAYKWIVYKDINKKWND